MLHLIVHFVGKKQWPEVKTYIIFWAEANGLKVEKERIRGKEVWGGSKRKGMWERTQSLKSFVSYVNANKKSSITAEAQNNQVDKVIFGQ